MQDLNASPRDAFTAAQIAALLVATPNPRYASGLEVLDASLKLLADISGNFRGGQITRTMRAAVHGTCSLNVDDDITFDPGKQLLRPYMLISDGVSTARFNCGVFRVARPTADWSAALTANAYVGSDRLSLLTRPIGDAYRVLKATQYLAAVRQVVDDAGLDPATVQLDGTKASAVLPADKTWPLLVDTSTSSTGKKQLTARDATSDNSTATTWLDVINDLLGAVNYRALWADQDGVFRSGPYVKPSARAVEFAFDFDDAFNAVIAPDRQLNVDQSDPVNVWIFQQSNLTDSAGNPIQPVEGAGQYTRVNQNYGPTSVDAQGGLEWKTVVQLDAADQATLVELGDAYVDQALSAASSYAVTSAPFPAAGHWDVYSYSDQRALGGAATLIATAWTLDLGDSTTPPADQTWTWEST